MIYTVLNRFCGLYVEMVSDFITSLRVTKELQLVRVYRRYYVFLVIKLEINYGRF